MAYTDYLHLSPEALAALRDELLAAKTRLLKGSMAESVIIDGNQISYSRINMPQLNAAVSEVCQALDNIGESGEGQILRSFCITHGSRM